MWASLYSISALCGSRSAFCWYGTDSIMFSQATCPLFQQLDRIVRADGMITLATKTNKDSPAMKRAKCRTSKTSPPPSESSTTSTAQFHPVVIPTPKPPDFLKITQRAQVHENQLMKLAKAIPSMIQTSIKKVMQPAKDKLKSL
ncbi:hypothetical protein HAX54_021054 [Datura stramonium]|uniref:Methyltransferase n=1 Tax=Datura stramonium TaxID=4076 RepID=A0ABS8UUX5_DATST|nr:hypothetical protein [Datura stramonium]